MDDRGNSVSAPPAKLFGFSLVLALSVAPAQSQLLKDYLISVQRSGRIQFRDPETLDVLRTIETTLPDRTTGLNGISVDPRGTTLYVEGPVGDEMDGQYGCCWLYAIDLSTMKSRVVADIWGTKSRGSFVKSGSSTLATASLASQAATQGKDSQWEASSNRLWWAGLRQGSWVDLYDVSQSKILNSFRIRPDDSDGSLSGLWLENQYYIYSANAGSGWLWHLAPDSVQLGEPQTVPAPDSMKGCDAPAEAAMSTVGDRLVFHEVFGGKIDRRDRCPGVPGGAWIVDPESGRTSMDLAPQFYFWDLTASGDGTSLYGVTSNALYGSGPVELVRFDARSGKTLKLVSLEPDYWYIAVARLRSMPPRDASLPLMQNPIP